MREIRERNAGLAWVLAASFIGASAQLGCATLNYSATHVKPVVPGQPLARPGKEVLDGDIPFDARLDPIKIFTSDDVPGFHYDKESSQLEAAPGSGNRVLGRVKLEFPAMENPALSFWFRSYRPEQSWRRSYCYPQVPLLWITLGLWAIVPLNYVCPPAPWHTGSLRELAGHEERKRLLYDALRAEAVRKGGNAVVNAYITHTNANGWIVHQALTTAVPTVPSPAP